MGPLRAIVSQIRKAKCIGVGKSAISASPNVWTHLFYDAFMNLFFDSNVWKVQTKFENRKVIYYFVTLLLLCLGLAVRYFDWGGYQKGHRQCIIRT